MITRRHDILIRQSAKTLKGKKKSIRIACSMHASTMYTRPQLCLTHGFQLLRMEAVAEILKNGRFFEIQFCGKAVLHCLNTTFSPKLPHIMRVFNQ